MDAANGTEDNIEELGVIFCQTYESGEWESIPTAEANEIYSPGRNRAQRTPESVHSRLLIFI